METHRNTSANVIIDQFSAIAKTADGEYGELPILIERLQAANDTFKTKTAQIALELEQVKIKNEKQARYATKLLR